MASVALLAGDAAARARAHVALSAGASLEEVEEARHLAEDVQTEQAFLSWLASSLRSCRRYGDALRGFSSVIKCISQQS
ncbi:unnamed protein product [Cladocopium goreaui]|uniref:Uncharacterized protein n=1 Tax=Cladocopium goreaui TaxID=2562237 RepID=A0A9P1G2D9_9DINO|nr:unnamed protein product [Cladocopium goreaui]